MQAALELLPALKHSQVTSSWASDIDSTLDGVPVIGKLAALPGLIVAAGFSGHGLGSGGGHFIADLVTAAPPIFDAKPYAPERFARPGSGKVADF